MKDPLSIIVEQMYPDTPSEHIIKLIRTHCMNVDDLRKIQAQIETLLEELAE